MWNKVNKLESNHSSQTDTSGSVRNVSTGNTISFQELVFKPLILYFCIRTCNHGLSVCVCLCQVSGGLQV